MSDSRWSNSVPRKTPRPGDQDFEGLARTKSDPLAVDGPGSNGAGEGDRAVALAEPPGLSPCPPGLAPGVTIGPSSRLESSPSSDKRSSKKKKHKKGSPGPDPSKDPKDAAPSGASDPADKNPQAGDESQTNSGSSTPAPPNTLDTASSEEEAPLEPVGSRWRLNTMVAGLFSAVLHLGLLLFLGLWVLPGVFESESPELTALTERPLDELNQTLDEEVDPTQELSLVTSSGALAPGAELGGGAVLGAVGTGLSSLNDNPAITEVVEATSISVGKLDTWATPGAEFAADLPEGTLGEPQAIVNNYQQAMDRITEEILLKLNRGKLLVVWCFDQSESMKDDQKEIRDRLDKVYQELGLATVAKGDQLTTAIVSYGDGFQVHTSKPTSDLEKIRAAISAVPNDPSGQERMCSAVGKAINTYIKVANGGKRQMMLVLVTDESGEPDDNREYLEAAIDQAQRARCAIYCLGREAVFGYPFAHMRWIDPKTGYDFYLRVNRGPETPAPEQLQIDGFRARQDAHPSGFGPYEEVRMARQTGGVFFMLPSIEVDLVAGEKRKYELERMRPYLPDVLSREDYFRDQKQSELRTVMAKVIYDLNPEVPGQSDRLTLPLTFPIIPVDFVNAARGGQRKASDMVLYIDAAEKAMEKLKPVREQEINPRWQANYDLIFAQLIAYKVRIYEYGAYLEEFIKTPKLIKNIYGPAMKTNYWGINTRAETITGDLTKDYIARSAAMLQKVIADHPGTPWAARAEWELNRGFGVELVEGYSAPRPGAESVKVPNL